MSALEDLIQLVDNPSDIDQLNEAWVTGLSSRAEQELKDATTYLTQVLADRENAYKEIRDMNTPMVCGHAGRYAVNSDEGTQYCVMCVNKENETAIRNIAYRLTEYDTDQECKYCTKTEWGSEKHDEHCPLALAYNILDIQDGRK